MISLLISLLIIIVIFGAIYYVLSMLPIPQPFRNIALVVIGLILFLVLLSLLLPLGGISPRWSVLR